MEEQRKPLSTKKPPIPSDDYQIIEAWMASRIMPGILPVINRIDSLIHELIPDLQYAVKWGKAYYGTQELGWLIEVAAYHVSANIVFLSGATFDHQPPLGTGESRYIKVRETGELNDQSVINYIQQAGRTPGWK